MKPINGYGDIIEIDTKNYSDIKNWIVFGIVITVLRR